MAVFGAALAADGLPPLTLGIGLHADPAIAGHVGSRSRHEYSALGDTTNIAARLHSLELGDPSLCSRAVAAALGYPEPLVALGPQALRGHSPLEIYGGNQHATAAVVVS
ncbi:MAG: adenylate/guanylate cyclase domain-containing protein [Sphingomonadaceae bacterium]